MSGEGKTTVSPWIAALLIGLPVLYVASFGPACWLVHREKLPSRRIISFYRPIVAVYANGPRPIEVIIGRYAGFTTASPGTRDWITQLELDIALYRVGLLPDE